MMEGFGVHTFRLVNAQGKSRFVQVPLEAAARACIRWCGTKRRRSAGKDPDFHRRDLWEAIERGDFPEWELGLQIVEEKDEHKFDFDLLDPTKLIPEELVPVRRVGKMTLNRNPDNFFAETEQVAFHTGHVVPGIDFTNDPLLQGRLFSYIDTQLRRVGPNFHEMPINRPLTPGRTTISAMAMARMTINKGRVAYFPNCLGGGCPMQPPGAAAAFVSYAEKMDGQNPRSAARASPTISARRRSSGTAWRDWEKDHIAAAFAFELNQVETRRAQPRMNEILVNIADALAERCRTRPASPSRRRHAAQPDASAPTPSGPLKPERQESGSPALSMDKTGRQHQGPEDRDSRRRRRRCRRGARRSWIG